MEKSLESKTSVNYWKEIEKNLHDELKNLQGTVLLTHNSAEFVEIINFLKNVRKSEFLNVLYISFVRSYDYMKKALELNPLDEKKMIFIDCVSGYAFPIEENIDDAFYHKPPKNLDEMKEIIQYGIDKINPEIIIIDSLSQFINFSKPSKDELDQLYEFLKTIKKYTMNVIQNTFILVYGTKLSIMKNLPKEAFDTILKIETVEKL